MRKEGSWSQVRIAVGIVCLVVLVGFFLLNFTDKGSKVTANVIKGLKDCEMKQVPYQVEEEYDYYLKNQVISGYQTEEVELFGKGVYREGIVKVMNTDNEAGWFIVTFNWETLYDKKTDSVRHYIEPDETIEFVSIYDNDLGEDTKFKYSVQSNVIKKTRMVTKYRTEEVCE